VAAALAVGLLLGGAPGASATTPTAGAASPTPVPATSATSLGESWAAELALDGGDDAGLVLSDGGVRLTAVGAPGRPAEGVLTLAPRRLAAPASGLAGVLTGDLPAGTGVDVQARGLGARGVWGDWLPVRSDTPARFATPTVDVQVRLLLHGSSDGRSTPVVREVWLTALDPARPAPPVTTTPTPPTPTTTTTRPTTTTPKPTPPKPTPPEPPTSRPGPPKPPTTTTTVPPTTTTTTTTRAPLVVVPPVVVPPVTVPHVLPAVAAARAITTTTVAPTATTTPPTTTTAPTTTAPTTTTSPTTTTTPTTATTSAPAKTLWDAAIATSGLQGFKDTPYNVTGRSSVEVIDGPPRAIRFTVPSGSQRAEIEPDVPKLTEGQTRFFRLTYVLPASFPSNPRGFQLATQWKNDGEGSPPLELRIEKGHFVLGGGYGRPGGSRLFSTDVAPVITGRPVDLVVGIRFSSDPAKGSVDVWVDGQQKVAGLRPPGGTLYPGLSSYWKIGLYRDTSNAGTATADLTSATMGTSYDALA
jgi:hypothetical protein